MAVMFRNGSVSNRKYAGSFALIEASPIRPSGRSTSSVSWMATPSASASSESYSTSRTLPRISLRHPRTKSATATSAGASEAGWTSQPRDSTANFLVDRHALICGSCCIFR